MSLASSSYKSHTSFSSLHQANQTIVTGNLRIPQAFSAPNQRDPMAHRKMAMGLAVVLVTMMWAGAMAQSGCTNVLISMSPCLNYITGNSSTPSSQCCTQLASVVRSSPQCLCAVLNGGGSSLGININQTQAIALPGACNVQTPPISRCNGKNAIQYAFQAQSLLSICLSKLLLQLRNGCYISLDINQGRYWNENKRLKNYLN